MQSIRDALRMMVRRVRSATQGGAFKLAGGAATGQVIGLAAYPLITRLYHPTDLGALSVYTSLVGIVAVIGCLRLEQAIPLPRRDADALALAAMGGLISIGVAALVLVAVLIQPDWFPGAEDAVSDLVSFLVPAGVLAIATYNTLNMFALREQRYGEVAKTRVVQGASLALIQVGGGLVGGGALALVAGHLGGNSAGAARLARLTVMKHRSTFTGLRPSRMVKTLRRYYKFMLVGAPSALLNAIGLLLGPILISQHYGLQAAGFFGLAITVLSVPVRLVGTSNAQVFYAESSRIIRTEVSPVTSRLRRVTWRLSMLGIAPALLLFVLGQQIFGLVFGEQWLTAGHFAAILVFAYLLAVISAPAAQTFLLVERQEVSLVLNMLKASAPIIGFALLPSAGADVELAIIVYAIVLGVYYLLVIALAFAVLARHGTKRK